MDGIEALKAIMGSWLYPSQNPKLVFVALTLFLITRIFSEDPTSKHLVISLLKSKNVIASPKLQSKPVRKDVKSSNNQTLPAHAKEGPDFRNSLDSKILYSSVPDKIHNLEMKVRGYKNATFLFDVHAMEEASAAEGVIRCLIS